MVIVEVGVPGLARPKQFVPSPKKTNRESVSPAPDVDVC